jgi:DNA polymerase III delta prime subunit
MAAVDVIAVMNTDEERSLHPFFARVDGTTSTPTRTCLTLTNLFAGSTAQLDNHIKDEQSSKPGRGRPKGRKPKPDGTHGSKAQRTLNEIINPKTYAKEHDSDVHDGETNPDPEFASRKRRKTSVESFVDPEREAVDDHMSKTISESVENPTESSSLLAPVITEQAEVLRTPSKKVLRLKANGTFSSPVTKEHVEPEESKAPTGNQARRRVQRSIEKSLSISLIVKCSYATSGENRLGTRIARILQGDERVKTTVRATKARTRKNAATTEQVADTHPFFQAKSQQADTPKPPTPRKMLSATTPGKLRAQALTDSPRVESREPTYNVGSYLLKDRLMFKHPGAKEPAFPDRHQMHVRGGDVSVSRKEIVDHTVSHFAIRKRKQNKSLLPGRDSVIASFASQLSCEDDRAVRSDGFLEPSRDLTVPQRLLLCGTDVAQRVSKQMVSQHDSKLDELELPSSQAPMHPAVQHLFARIPTTVTAYDESRGEALPWTQKYAPTAGSDVLQPELEMTVLKDWLKALSVHAVSGAASGKASIPLAEKPKKKRKKKNAEMDDFLVKSDEEDSEMHDLYDDQETEYSSHGNKSMQKSIVRSVNPHGRLNNTLIISGPSGCGKTAAAYAVAKELGFKIFEISSSERRSGKDVLDKIGNMAENHLVKHHGTSHASNAENIDTTTSDEPARLDEAFQKDLESGRQGKMNAFFKPQVKSILTQATKKPAKGRIAAKAIKDVQEVLKKPTKDQQQSLILLEEVDVMFRDDKDFWPTILKLIATSKRPFLMTCNDETLLPMQTTAYHAILRFTTPPREIAADYILAVAAAEGHLIDRDAVTWLYDYHSQDLRASLTELDFWCQMAVGDPRSGLTWIFQRWPPGADLDSKGRKLRVVSQGTYTKGMSLTLSRDISTEDALAWAWRELGIDPATALGWHDPHLGCNTQPSALENLQNLESFAQYTDALSISDLVGAQDPFETPLCDPTQRPLTDQQRNQYIEGHRLLQTDAHADFSTLTFDLTVAINVAALRACDLLHQSSLTDPTTIRDTMLPRKSAHESTTSLIRRDFACFDDLAITPDSGPTLGLTILQSVFDGPLTPIALDIAPYVRAILRYDEDLAEHRQQLNALLSDGRGAKKARTTRAARSAMEGGQRASTRRETWFAAELNVEDILATGGQGWMPRNPAKLPLLSADEYSMEEIDSD